MSLPGGEIVLIISGIVLILLIFSNYVVTENQLTTSRLTINKLQSQFEEYEKTMNLKYYSLNNRIKTLESNDRLHNVALTQLKNSTRINEDRILAIKNASDMTSLAIIRLNNHTTNADLKDDIDRIKTHVNTQLDTTLAFVDSSINAMERNLTEQMLLTKNEMQHSIGRVNHIADDAKKQLLIMQDKVTEQVYNVSHALNDTLHNVDMVVATASLEINEEVSDIQSDIHAYVAFSNKQFQAENDFVKYQLAGTFTLIACLISMYHMTQHQKHFVKPNVQRRIMAILWMVPVYSLTSWLSLVFGASGEVFFNAIRDIYEAYVVYTFFGLLIAVLEEGKGLNHLIERITLHVENEQRGVVQAQRLGKTIPVEHIKPPFPCCYDYHIPIRIAITWLYQCKLMVMQFVLLKPLLTFMPVVFLLFGVDYYNIPVLLDPSNDLTLYQRINFGSPQLYVLIMENISVTLAFYGLLSFYHGTEKELAWCEPWPKFVCVKSIVFMTFWQGICINAMSSLGMVDEKAAGQIQNLLICIEMLVASLAHVYVFPYKEWEEGYKKDKQIMLRDTLAFRDFMKDVKQMVTRWSTGEAVGRRTSYGSSESGSPVKKRPSSIGTFAMNMTDMSPPIARSTADPSRKGSLLNQDTHTQNVEEGFSRGGGICMDRTIDIETETSPLLRKSNVCSNSLNGSLNSLTESPFSSFVPEHTNSNSLMHSTESTAFNGDSSENTDEPPPSLNYQEFETLMLHTKMGQQRASVSSNMIVDDSNSDFELNVSANEDTDDVQMNNPHNNPWSTRHSVARQETKGSKQTQGHRYNNSELSLMYDECDGFVDSTSPNASCDAPQNKLKQASTSNNGNNEAGFVI